MVGNFANRGQVWSDTPLQVNAHDFRSDAECIASPYGIYEVGRNKGFVCIGTSSDTPEFAADAIREWWLHAREIYPCATKLLILADSGGSNGCRPRLFKQQIQERLADEFGLQITVCHYPTGTSKWNPVEHRLFSAISGNWAGVPLASLNLMVGLIKDTTNKAGLSVDAVVTEKTYLTGKRVTNREMKLLNIEHHNPCPQWNYTIRPRNE